MNSKWDDIIHKNIYEMDEIWKFIYKRQYLYF